MLKSVRMSKKAQVTIFVVVAVLVVALVGVSYVVVNNKSKGSDANLSPEAQVFKTYMDDCLKDVLRDSIVHIGLQGGYFSPPDSEDRALDFFGVVVPYYLYEKENLIISEKRLVSELSQAIEVDAVSVCAAGFTDSEYGIEVADADANVILGDESVKLQLNLPVVITKGEIKSEVKEYETEVPIRLKEVYDNSVAITKTASVEPYHLCIDCVDAVRDNNIIVNAFTWQDNTLIFRLSDYASRIDDNNPDPYRYYFAIKYIDWSCDNLPSDIDNYIKEECDLR